MGAAPGNKGGSIGSAIATDLSRHRATMPCGNKGGGMPRAGGEPGTTSVGPGIQTENLNYLLLKKNFHDSVDGDIHHRRSDLCSN